MTMGYFGRYADIHLSLHNITTYNNFMVKHEISELKFSNFINDIISKFKKSNIEILKTFLLKKCKTSEVFKK